MNVQSPPITESFPSLPSFNVVPSTPPANTEQREERAPTTAYATNRDYYDQKSEEVLAAEDQDSRHVHYPPDASTDGHHTHQEEAPSRLSMQNRPREPVPKTQHQILTALAVGAPLIASVVSSCTSVISADFTSALGDDPSARPAKASAAVALLWCALITSLGSTMTAVAGLALHAGYHDSHVGVTKRIVRFLRQWREEHKAARRRSQQSQTLEAPYVAEYRSSMHLDVRPMSPALSAVTDDHRDQHMVASFRAAVVSARLLGLSVALLSVAIAVYLFLLYPISVAATTLVVGIGTAVVAAAPLLPILMPNRQKQ
ncbi:hypothetical protein D9758_017156 [Tetrapyrgos nigripes]|uniref:Transmembrane protein n=1 Tax=Tetrapyrgos nigripes TaxID=182062 RepID=A0A8H5BVH9_9AGAR|nr:hypothetical protein D9758_017156 [Tetrapyrgos nigripes]